MIGRIGRIARNETHAKAHNGKKGQRKKAVERKKSQPTGRKGKRKVEDTFTPD